MAECIDKLQINFSPVALGSRYLVAKYRHTTCMYIILLLTGRIIILLKTLTILRKHHHLSTAMLLSSFTSFTTNFKLKSIKKRWVLKYWISLLLTALDLNLKQPCLVVILLSRNCNQLNKAAFYV